MVDFNQYLVYRMEYLVVPKTSCPSYLENLDKPAFTALHGKMYIYSMCVWPDINSISSMCTKVCYR